MSKEETKYFIERTITAEWVKTVYLQGYGDSCTKYTNDPIEALRFDSRGEAEDLMSILELISSDTLEVTEHQFVNKLKLWVRR